MKAGNFEALLCTDPIFTALKVLNPLKKYNKNQEASYNFKLGFALSNIPHFNSVYLVGVPFLTGIAVFDFFIFLHHTLKENHPKEWNLLTNKTCTYSDVGCGNKEIGETDFYKIREVPIIKYV